MRVLLALLLVAVAAAAGMDLHKCRAALSFQDAYMASVAVGNVKDNSASLFARLAVQPQDFQASMVAMCRRESTTSGQNAKVTLLKGRGDAARRVLGGRSADAAR